ncbi:uncharacterized protein C8Q71DRAFT_282746 [Rhodofomes roseus]|uniref:Uncharacterized protein n=1 Tax=Rhodofomes roseus TaxID=34475 RepID=A0ABQ8K4C1_9APHY|nr:uncharacterized protein C8Q71DRAFT_282746 [Rhodofomes roseus]KAH9831715.1 hypothetical protein C8Q71DRAFT_282746 [Rhodofomes roseus]
MRTRETLHPIPRLHRAPVRIIEGHHGICISRLSLHIADKRCYRGRHKEQQAPPVSCEETRGHPRRCGTPSGTGYEASRVYTLACGYGMSDVIPLAAKATFRTWPMDQFSPPYFSELQCMTDAGHHRLLRYRWHCVEVATSLVAETTKKVAVLWSGLWEHVRGHSLASCDEYGFWNASKSHTYSLRSALLLRRLIRSHGSCVAC